VISLSRTSVTLECPLSGASEKAKISVLALLRNNSQFGTNGSGKVLALPLYAKYLTIIRNVFFANYIFAIFLLYLLRQLIRAVNTVTKRMLPQILFSHSCRYCSITESFRILIKLKQISKASFMFTLEIIMY